MSNVDVYYNADAYFLGAFRALLEASREFGDLPAREAERVAYVMSGLYQGDAQGMSLREFAAGWAPQYFESQRALRAVAGETQG